MSWCNSFGCKTNFLPVSESEANLRSVMPKRYGKLPATSAASTPEKGGTASGETEQGIQGNHATDQRDSPGNQSTANVSMKRFEQLLIGCNGFVLSLLGGWCVVQNALGHPEVTTLITGTPMSTLSSIGFALGGLNFMFVALILWRRRQFK